MPEPPQDMQLDGTIVVERDEAWDQPDFMLDLSTGTKKYFPWISGLYEVSPDHKFLAYFDLTSEDKRLVVIDAAGNEIFTKIDQEDEWEYLQIWVNSENILISKYKAPPYEDMGMGAPLPSVLLNPFTQEERELPLIFPGIIDYENNIAWIDYGLTATAYDPTMSRVVYLRAATPSEDKTIVLWDMEGNKEVADLPSSINLGRGPVWYQDGSKFIISLLVEREDYEVEDSSWKQTEELFSMSSGGDLSRLTTLTKYFSEVGISGYRWSPDGRYIAFWLYLGPGIYPEFNRIVDAGLFLTLLDTHDKSLTSYCLSPRAPFIPIWSPNGEQIAVSIQEGDGSITVIVDIQKRLAFKIAEDTIPSGWMVNPPEE